MPPISTGSGGATANREPAPAKPVASGPPARRPAATANLVLGVVGLIWGASYLFFKLGLDGLPVPVLVLLRTGLAALTLAAYVAITRGPAAPPGLARHWWRYLLLALFNAVLPWLGIALAQEYISTSLSGLIYATNPLFVVLLSALVYDRAERPGRWVRLGVATGFVGVLIVLLPSLLGGRLRASVIGIGLMTFATICDSIGPVYQRRWFPRTSPILSTLWQMTLGGLVLVPLAAPFFGQTQLVLKSLLAVAGLGVLGTAVALVLYFWLLNRVGAARASFVTYLAPLGAIFWGVTILHESLAPIQLLGAAVVLAGVYLVNRSESRVTGTPRARPRGRAGG